MGKQTAETAKANAEKLVKAFGTGFILKKNVAKFALAGVGEEWIQVLEELRRFAPSQFAQTFEEFESKVRAKRFFERYVGTELMKLFGKFNVCCNLSSNAREIGGIKQGSDDC